jgi:hypothetical protein
MERLSTPTLMVPENRLEESEGDLIISGRDETGLLNGIGHFTRREAPDAVATTILRHAYTANV